MVGVTHRSVLHPLDTVSECGIFILTQRMQFCCCACPELQDADPGVFICFIMLVTEPFLSRTETSNNSNALLYNVTFIIKKYMYLTQF